MISTAAALTNQFYEWEKRGRGWAVAAYSCDLEPPFVPFFGHVIDRGEIIDDGKQPSFWNTALSGVAGPDKRPVIRQQKEQIAYPYNGISGSLTVYTVTLPKQFKQNKERIGQFLVMLSYSKSPVSFEIIGTEDEIILECVTQDRNAEFFYSQMRVFFPECTVVETATDKLFELVEDAACIYTVDFGLQEECMRPIAQFISNDQDPYMPLFGILERLDTDETVIIQMLFCGVHNAWAESMQKSVCDDSGKQSFFLDAPEMPQLAKEKVSKPLFAVTVRVVTISDTMEQAATLLSHVAIAVVHASTSSTNSLVPLQGNYPMNIRLADIVMRESHRVGMLLNVSELATFVHFPALPSKKLIATTHATKQAPLSLTDHSYILGVNDHQRIEQVVSIATDQRLRHIHILGATGTGKSTLLKSLMMQDIYQGLGLMCLDPHGDLIEDILENIPEERIQDVVLIDPHDADFPIGLNILVAHSDIERELLASDLVAVFRRFSTTWGDAMNSVFANAILAFMYNTKQYHLGDLRRFLIEAPYRAQILSSVTDSDIVYYWQYEFPILKSSSIGSILTRLDAFLRPKVIRNMICQKQSLDFAHLMDSNKIVLVKLSQGLLGTENSYLLGAFIVSKLQQTAMSRQAQGAKDRIPFFCYIDEFQHFITPSMASILSGARKYGLGLVLSHQDMQQVSKYDTEIASSVLANAGTRICFRLGDTDAKRLEDGFSSFSAEDLQNLSTGETIVRVNTMDADFNLTVVPYARDIETNNVIEIIEHSRRQYSVPIVMHQTAIIVEPEPIIKQQQQPLVKEHVRPTIIEDDAPIATQEAVREHRYLQTFVKAMAEAQGYKASLEVPTPDSTGLVDVLLEKGAQTIAVEISVTTTPEWELHNIKKCLAAGYGHIVICATQLAKLKLIQQQITTHLTAQEQKKVQIILSNDIQSVFESNPQTQPTETLVKGYRVKVNYEPNPNRQDLLQSIIRATKK
jgi:hypothetical protein